jgi:hypothetical protein
MIIEDFFISSFAISESRILSLGKNTVGKSIPLTRSSADVFLKANKVTLP